MKKKAEEEKKRKEEEEAAKAAAAAAAAGDKPADNINELLNDMNSGRDDDNMEDDGKDVGGG